VTPDPLLATLSDDFFRDRSEDDCISGDGLFCAEWAISNLERYAGPTAEHAFLVLMAVAAGFAIAFSLALLAHRKRWLRTPFLAATGILYTIPSISFFFLLLPITGRGTLTAIIALTAFSLQIIFRNVATGLANVPEASREAARGMGMTDRQAMWRVEVPLALPEIIANITFKTGIIMAGSIAILMAILFDGVLILTGRLLSPWRRAEL